MLDRDPGLGNNKGGSDEPNYEGEWKEEVFVNQFE
jgi:hypothetical protein